MTANKTETKRRELAARNAILKSFDSDSEGEVALFVSHHVEELDSKYWMKHLASAKPDPHRVLELLVLKSRWGGDADIDTFDFTLPDEVTDYVISVSFNVDGQVSEIAMES